MSIHVCPMCMRVSGEKNCAFCGHATQSVEPACHTLPPETILAGKYMVGRVLGQGGFGITYLGLNIAENRRCAIKEFYLRNGCIRDNRLSLQVGVEESSRILFAKGRDDLYQEAERMRLVGYLPHTVHVREAFSENGTSYMVMDYIEGQSLEHYRQARGAMAPEALFPMMRPLLSDLAAMHAHHLLHRDLSPGNIMMDDRQALYLIDFGSSRLAEPEKRLTVYVSRPYAPPEQYNGYGAQGPWTDVYGLCATLYCMLTGVVPPDVNVRKANDTLTPPSQLGVKLSASAEQAILRGMRLSPQERIQSMGELTSALFPADPGSGPEAKRLGWKNGKGKKAPMQRAAKRLFPTEHSRDDQALAKRIAEQDQIARALVRVFRRQGRRTLALIEQVKGSTDREAQWALMDAVTRRNQTSLLGLAGCCVALLLLLRNLF